MLRFQQQKGKEVRMKSFGETRCMNPQKPKTKIKIVNRKKYKELYRMNCLIGYRNSGRIWLIKYFRKASERPDAEKCTHTLPVRLIMFQRSRASIRGPEFGYAQCIDALSEGSKLWLCLKTKITRASCRWRANAVQKRFTLTIPWDLASLVRSYPGIIVRRHHTDRKHMGLLKDP